VDFIKATLQINGRFLFSCHLDTTRPDF
jgi:hypothetical protein